MKKFVLKLDMRDDRELQRKAFKIVASLSGIDEIAIDLKGKKLTVIGTVDPVAVVSKLRKKDWTVDIVSCGPKAEPKKEEAKKEQGSKKEEGKKQEPKKEEAKKGGRVKPNKGEEKKIQVPIQPPETVLGTAFQYHHHRPYYPPMQRPSYYHVNHSIEENPNACVIS